MRKLNSVVYNKLLLQAEEAKEQNMKKLASGILGSLSAQPEDENVSYSVSNMNDDVYTGLWKLATCVMKYYDVESVNAEKVNEVIESLAGKFISEMEDSIRVDSGDVGPLEPKLPGQK